MITKHKLVKFLLVIIPLALMIGVAHHYITLWIEQPNKREWFCMQHFARTGENHDSCSPIIDLPAEPGKIKGGIFIMTKAKGYEKVKWMGRGGSDTGKDFAFTKDAYEEIKKKNSLSREVEEFLAARVVSDLEMKEWTCVLWPEEKKVVNPLHKGYTITKDEGCPPLITLYSAPLRVDANSVRILSTAKGVEKVKKSWDSFSMIREVYEEIKASISLSDEVDNYLAERIVNTKEIIRLTCLSRAPYPGKLPYLIVTRHPCPPVITFREMPGKVVGFMKIVSDTKDSFPFQWKGVSTDIRDYAITREIYKEIKATTKLSKEADEFLFSIINEKKVIEEFCFDRLSDYVTAYATLSNTTKDTSSPFKIITNVSCPPVISFMEKKDKVTGRARVLTQPKGDVYFLWEGSDSFSISKAIYEEIKAAVPLSKEADKFLASRIISDLDMKEWACVDWPRKEIDPSVLTKDYAIIEDENCPPLIVLKPMRKTPRPYRILSRAEGTEKVKRQFWDEFPITEEMYKEIKTSVPLSDEVDSFLAKSVVSREEIELPDEKSLREQSQKERESHEK